MPRLVKIETADPYKLETAKGKVWICQCGLSKNKPFCDGSHTRTLGEDKGKMYMYSSFTQKRKNVSPLLYSDNSCLTQRPSELIYKSNERRIWRIHKEDKRYEIIQQIRAKANVVSKDEYDNWSDLYLLELKDHYCATMRVTQARDGELDVEANYPEFLKDPKVRPLVGSAGKLCRVSNPICQHKDIFLFIQEVWKDQYVDGMRIDLINATLRMAAYYERLGYFRVGDHFIHPVTKKDSVALAYIAHPDNSCALTDQLTCFLKENYRRVELLEDLKAHIY